VGASFAEKLEEAIERANRSRGEIAINQMKVIEARLEPNGFKRRI
jgi:hypothetical protein